MSVSVSRRTWEEASSPAAVHLAREYERFWRDSDHLQHRPDLHGFLEASGGSIDGPGARLALLRADMMLRWEAGEKTGAQWYLDHHADLSEDTIVALVYEEFCLREEDEEKPSRSEFLARFSQVAGPLSRVLEIHQLVGVSSSATALFADGSAAGGTVGPFPEAGQMIAGFHLVEELGRGAFARVFLARERQLADRPVALKVTRRGSCEPQALARLQHTHIVPVHSHRIDQATGLHLLCMPYFGRTTLAQVLADCRERDDRSGTTLVEALDRLEPGDEAPAGASAGRSALASRSFDRAIAWWGARLAEALAHAHDRGVLHRDIKPSNVLVTADGMPMLLDFNLAREPLAGPSGVGVGGGGATLGGTVDYMAPEHLLALAEGGPETVDGRSDIYSLGVVLFEALTGRRPFAAPRHGPSVLEALLRAADERRRSVPRPRAFEPAVSPALDAIVRRCLAPEPADRYALASELASDLQAVADDLPLPHVREPWNSRLGGWFRRRRRPLGLAAAATVALAAILVVSLGQLINRADTAGWFQKELEKGVGSFDDGEYELAMKQLDATIDLIKHFDDLDPRKYPSRWQGLPHTIEAVAHKLGELNFGPNLDDMRRRAHEKRSLAERYARTRRDADALFETARRLRFHLLLDGDRGRAEASVELKNALAPFYVLTSDDWTKLNSVLEPLDPPRLHRLRTEINELLFFWVAELDRALSTAAPTAASQPRTQGLAYLIAICDQALAFAEPKEPWRALRDRIARSGAGRDAPPARPAPERGPDFAGEPRDVGKERSALASFQWALLELRADRLGRAVQWMRHAVQLEQHNYWYQYFLAYIEDQAGLYDEALKHYSIAMALEPHCAWARFSLAKLYRSKGLWSEAINDMKGALEELRGHPEARKVHLELGYLYQELGDFARARAEYDQVTATNTTDSFARAARLNRTNLDVESGHAARAMAEYGALLSLADNDTAVRYSRALLELRIGQAAGAEIDLTALLDQWDTLKHPEEALAARALARLMARQPVEALADAVEARRAHPCPAHQRLWQRAVLAARRFDQLQLDRPDFVALLPIGGKRLESDLRAAAAGLAPLAAGQGESAYRATLTRSVILAALGDRDGSVAAASRALALSPYSAQAYLIRGRALAAAGARGAAAGDVRRGLALHPDEPGLIELHGALLHAAGDPAGAIEAYNRAIDTGALDGVHALKAAALGALGHHDAAVVEWSLALRRDPELPQAFLGRAGSHIRLGHWDLALADLEQTASWADADPRLEVAVATAYIRCLAARPDRLPRFLALARRAALDVWSALNDRARPALAPDRARS